MHRLQNVIHRLEVGEGKHLVLAVAGLLLFVSLAVAYNLREARSFGTPEAMDQAQIARNIARGEGSTTRFVRPLSLRLVAEDREDASLVARAASYIATSLRLAPGRREEDPGSIKGNHPDLAHAPAWPLVLSLAMRILPFEFDIPEEEVLERHQPEILVGCVNQGLFLLSALVLFVLARRVFDWKVALFSTAVFLGTDLLWRFCFSGLSTHLAILQILLLTLVLHHLAGSAKGKRQTCLAALCGLLLGTLVLTRYSLGCLMLPVGVFLATQLSTGTWRTLAVAMLLAGLLVVPWLARNHHWSGHWFGTAGLAVLQDTRSYRDDSLERTLVGEMAEVGRREIWHKLHPKLERMVREDIPTVGGSWITVLFLAGILVPFHRRLPNRLRGFTLMSLFLLAIVQALGETHLAGGEDGIHGQNHLILVFPLICLFGSGLFFVLMERLNIDFGRAHAWFGSLVVLVLCLPLIFRLLTPRDDPFHHWPPYHPGGIQGIAEGFGEDELIMSDIPWAVSWYGDRQCIWIPRTVDPDFRSVHEDHKPVNGLYLTRPTTDRSILVPMADDLIDEASSITQLVSWTLLPEGIPEEVVRRVQRNGHPSWTWGRFYLGVLFESEVPTGFPLRYLHGSVRPGWMFPGQMILTDRDRWEEP